MRDAILARVGADLGVPTLPDVALQVMEASQDDACDLGRLESLISRDPGLAAYLLRVANSASFAASVPVLSIQQGITRVGLSMVGDMALALSVGKSLFSAKGHEARMRQLWHHSLATACYAHDLAQVLRLDFQSAFLCGLLHDVGMALALQILSDLECAPGFPRLGAELLETVLFECHGELGAALASSWKLGPWVDLVIRNHHEPERTNYHPHEVPLVCLADLLAEWALDPTLEEIDFLAPTELLAALGLHEGALGSLLRRRERVRQEVEDLC